VIAEGVGLPCGKTGSGAAPPGQRKQASTTAKSERPDATIMARGDSEFGTKQVIGACMDNSRVLADHEPETPGHHGDRGHDETRSPGAISGQVEDPETGALIS